MRKIKIVAAIILFSGCSELFPSDGRYTVVDIDFTSSKHEAIYRLVPIEGRGSIYFVDSIGKFTIYDTLVLNKK